MPSRSIKNRTRGNQKRALPAKAKPAPADLVQNFDGRKNTNAGSFERHAAGETPTNDRIVKWSN